MLHRHAYLCPAAGSRTFGKIAGLYSIVSLRRVYHKEFPKIYQIECQKECQNILCQKVCQNRCQICQNTGQKECQIEGQNEYCIYNYAICTSRWHVRDYVRIVFQGGDHSKKVMMFFVFVVGNVLFNLSSPSNES